MCCYWAHECCGQAAKACALRMPLGQAKAAVCTWADRTRGRAARAGRSHIGRPKALADRLRPSMCGIGRIRLADAVRRGRIDFALPCAALVRTWADRTRGQAARAGRSHMGRPKARASELGSSWISWLRSLTPIESRCKFEPRHM